MLKGGGQILVLIGTSAMKKIDSSCTLLLKKKIGGGSSTRLPNDCGRIEIRRHKDWRQFSGT